MEAVPASPIAPPTLTLRTVRDSRRGMTREVTIGAVRLGRRPVVVAAGGEADLHALETAPGDVVELRADLFDQPDRATVEAALGRLRAARRQIIFTARAAAEGGRAMPEERRADLYRAALPLVDAIDLEIASADLAAELVPRARSAGRTVILSAHDFAATPARDALVTLVDRGRHLGADLAKLATLTTTLDDLRTLLEVTLATRVGGVVTLGMGTLGPLSRLILPAAGSLLTYGAAGHGTAPGQTVAADLAAEIRRLFP